MVFYLILKDQFDLIDIILIGFKMNTTLILLFVGVCLLHISNVVEGKLEF